MKHQKGISINYKIEINNPVTSYDPTTATKAEPYGQGQFLMPESPLMSENLSQGLIRAGADTTIHGAIQSWPEGSTRAETFDRASKLRDKSQLVRGFLNFVGKHPGEITPEEVRRWRS